MKSRDFTGDPARDRTPAAAFYTDSATLHSELEQVFARSWQLVGHAGQLAGDGDFFTASIGHEPLLFVNDAGTLRGFFNVCRHRAGPIATGCGRQRVFSCRYHGWTYDRSGQMLRAPDMEGVADFDPRTISLEKVSLHRWGNLLFATLDPGTPPFEEFHADLLARTADLRIDSLRHVRSRTYEVRANWKIYIDNYLEGYHIPLVHPALNRSLEFDNYVTTLGRNHTLQHAPVREGGNFRRAHGEGAWYFWLFPNMMLNIFQGQLQSNLVTPDGVDRCLVRFDWFAPEPLPDLERDPRWLDLMRVADQVQAEDAGICEAVQRNIVSRAYRPGPYSMAHEQGVHYFHSLLRHWSSKQGA
jgi:choline monooxygenase